MRRLESVLALRSSDWWGRDEEKQRRTGTGDSTIHLSLILCMIPSLCLSCNIPHSPLCACLCFHSSCLCLAELYLLSFQPPPFPFPSLLVCVFIQHSSSQKASLSFFFFSTHNPHLPSLYDVRLSLIKSGKHQGDWDLPGVCVCVFVSV